MAFDVEGAMKAGYSEAEIAGHMAKESGFDITGAKKVGYSDAEVIKHLRGEVKRFDKPAPKEKGFGEQLQSELSDIPRQLGLTARHGIEGVLGTVGIVTDPLAKLFGVPTGEQTGKNIGDMLGLPTPQTKIEKIVAEPTKLLAGGGGLLGGARMASRLPGVVGEVGSMLASNPAQQLQSAAGAGAAGGYVKETGGGGLAQGGAALAGGLAAPGIISAVRGIPNAAKSTVEFLAPGLTTPRTLPEVDIVITNILENKGLKIGDVSASVLNQLRADVAEALKANGTLADDAMARLADYRMVGATPRRGNLTLDPGDISREKNLAKFGINSADPKLQVLGQIDNANNRTLIEGLNRLGANTGQDAISGANKVMGSLNRLDSAAKSQIKSAYDAARASDGRSALIDPYSFTQKANDLLDEKLLSGAISADVRNKLNSIAKGDTPLTVDVAEQFKTNIGNLQRATNNSSERLALGYIRQALDDAPLLGGQGQGAIDAFNNARSLNRKYMSVVDRVPALAAVRDGIEPDKFVSQFIIGNGTKASVMDVAKLKTLIKSDPEAMNAVRGQILSDIKSKALNGASDEIGSFSQSAFNKALNAIGDRKLKLFFSKDELAQIKAIARVSSYEQVQPRGSAVNNSNTAGAALAQIFDKLANAPIIGKIPMVPQIAGNISASLNARRALNAPKAIVNPENKSMIAPFMLPGLAGAGLLGP